MFFPLDHATASAKTLQQRLQVLDGQIDKTLDEASLRPV